MSVSPPAAGRFATTGASLPWSAVSFTAWSDIEGIWPHDTAVRGSSGGYLSNEITYRSLLLQKRLGSRVPPWTPAYTSVEAVTTRGSKATSSARFDGSSLQHLS